MDNLDVIKAVSLMQRLIAEDPEGVTIDGLCAAAGYNK